MANVVMLVHSPRPVNKNVHYEEGIALLLHSTRHRDRSGSVGSGMSAAQHLPVADLTPEERAQLRGLRKRKAELINEIEQIKGQLQNVESELETLYYVDDTSKERQTLFTNGRKRFNVDPQAGLDFLFERGLLERTPASVANFLYKGEGLSKTSIGDFLGSNEEFNLDVLDEFVRCHDFSNLFIVDALRQFLWSFRLPGESQKIDRIMQKFAAHFHTTQGTECSFDCADTCYFLAYSCVMLNTLLHNKAVKEKTSLEVFASMTRDVMQKNGVSMNIISQIYDSIQRQEFAFPEDDSSRLAEPFMSPEREGWLYKQGSSQTFVVAPLMWKRRWFVLSDACLYYFENSVDRTPKGIIPLKNVGVRRVESPPRPHMFEIFSLSPEEKIKACKTEQSGGRVFEGRHQMYRMCASSQEDLRAWIEAISVHCQPLRPKSTH